MSKSTPKNYKNEHPSPTRPKPAVQEVLFSVWLVHIVTIPTLHEYTQYSVHTKMKDPHHLPKIPSASHPTNHNARKLSCSSSASAQKVNSLQALVTKCGNGYIMMICSPVGWSKGVYLLCVIVMGIPSTSTYSVVSCPWKCYYYRILPSTYVAWSMDASSMEWECKDGTGH